MNEPDPSHPVETSIGNRMAVGAAWMITFRLSERLLGLVSTVILARLLVPADFGLVAMAATVIAFLEVFTMNDFGSAIIQNKNATRDDYDTAWTMDTLLGVFAAAVIVALAIPAAHFFQNDRLVPVLLVLAVYPLLDGVYNIGCIDFRKYMQFDKDFVLQMTKKLSGILISIPLAFLLRNHWALIGGMLAGRVGALIASYAMHPFRPRWSLKSAAAIWAFSRWILVNNALAFVTARGSHLVIGRLSNSSALGLYSVAFDLANLPTSELAMPINRAVFPGYAQMQEDRVRMKAGFLRVLGVMALIAVPAGVGLAAVAPIVVPLLLGEKWLDAIPILQVLAVAGSVTALHANVESVYFALGLTRLRALVTGVQAAISLPLTFVAVSHWGVLGAAYAVAITALLVGTFNLWQSARLLEVSAADILKALLRPLAGIALMVLALQSFNPNFGVSGALGLGLLLGVKVLGGLLVYASTVFLAWKLVRSPEGAEAWVLRLVAATIARVRPRTHR